jgi:hypothetical protein
VFLIILSGISTAEEVFFLKKETKTLALRGSVEFDSIGSYHHFLIDRIKASFLTRPFINKRFLKKKPNSTSCSPAGLMFLVLFFKKKQDQSN